MFSLFQKPKVYTDEELFFGIGIDKIDVDVAVVEKAQLGDGQSLCIIGDMYYNRKTMTSFWKAMACYRRSAMKNNSDAQNMIGYIYQHGLGEPVNYNQAIKWYQKSAKQGNMKAQNNLGFIFDEGHGVPIDYNRAIYWYTKSATQGYSYAQYNLAMMFENGNGVEVNKQLALEWYQKCANSGDLDAIGKVKELECTCYSRVYNNEKKEGEDKVLDNSKIINSTDILLSVN